VLVIGGLRFIGPHVVHGIVRAGADVTLFHRSRDGEGAVPSTVRHVYGDADRIKERIEELRGARPDVVLDTIALRREDGRRVRLFSRLAHRAVVLSSVDVYRASGVLQMTEPGPLEPLPLTESSPLRAHSPPDYDKRGVEEEARADPSFPVTALRLPAVHGPGDYKHRLYEYVRRMDDGRPFVLLDERLASWRWCRGYVENVAHAIVRAVLDERAAGRAYNVSDPATHTERRWVEAIARAHGWRGELIEVPAGRLGDDDEPLDHRQDMVMDTTRIRTELDFAEPVDEHDGLLRTIAWERAHRPRQASRDADYAREDRLAASIASRRRRAIC
jgi:nucleoside-diphosphate-sugar epimerase